MPGRISRRNHFFAAATTCSVTRDTQTSPITLRNVGKTYDDRGSPVQALDDVSLTLPRGSFTAIMGPSGAGKSTLMHLIGCLDTPSAGTVTVAGKNSTTLSSAERTRVRATTIGFVFQTFQLLSRLTALQNVALPMAFQGLARSARTERARTLLSRVGLENRTDHLPAALSGGQRQRVAIARALANDPRLLLADEPTGNLDTETGDRILRRFTELHDEGNTILVVTHERRVAEYAQRIIHLQDGAIVQTERLTDDSSQQSTKEGTD
jgi:putative ABC transport system ATP-binding protein